MEQGAMCEHPPPYLRSQMAKNPKSFTKPKKFLGKNAIKNFLQNFSHFFGPKSDFHT